MHKLQDLTNAEKGRDGTTTEQSVETKKALMPFVCAKCAYFSGTGRVLRRHIRNPQDCLDKSKPTSLI